MPEATKTCPHCGAPEDQEFPFMFLCGSSTKVVRRTWACHHIEAMNLVTAVHADAPPGRRSDQAAWLNKAEITRAVVGGYRTGAGVAVWIDPGVAHEIAERIAAASFAKGGA